MSQPDYTSVLQEIDPRRARFRMDELGQLALEIQVESGEWQRYERVRVARTFPITAPEEYVSFFDEKDRYLGMVRDLRRCGRGTRKLLLEELERRYFMPVISQIHNLQLNAGISSWDVETDRGRHAFDVRDRDAVFPIPPYRLLIRDADGNRYEIPDQTQLDRRSRDLLAQLL